MFKNREEAGEALIEAVRPHADADAIVYALPRGGVPVAAPIAKALGAPIDLIFVRKIGAPGHTELAIGAMVDGDNPVQIMHDEAVRTLDVSDAYIESESKAALDEIHRRRALYAGLYARVAPKDKTAIIVDDGLATGASMEAAIKAMRQTGAKKIIVAVPVAPSDTLARLAKIADSVVCLETPEPFWSVGGNYESFPQLKDADVMEILNEFTPDDGTDDGKACLVRKRA